MGREVVLISVQLPAFLEDNRGGRYAVRRYEVSSVIIFSVRFKMCCYAGYIVHYLL